jgi:hypothetical protein
MLASSARVGRAAWRWVRRGIRLVAPSAVVLAVCGCRPSSEACNDAADVGDCETPSQASDPGTHVCTVSPLDVEGVGVCVPLVDNGWHLGLFQKSELLAEEPGCPAIAPNPGLTGVEVPSGGSMARYVIGCSIVPYPSCELDKGMICVPAAEGYETCASQDGPQGCPSPWYLDKTTVEKDGEGGEATVCCLPVIDGPE